MTLLLRMVCVLQVAKYDYLPGLRWCKAAGRFK
jgi:hypothetical protein